MRAGERFTGECDGATFEIWGVLSGSALCTVKLADVTLEAVDWALLPAALGRYEVEATSDATLLRVYTPDMEQAA